MVIKAYLECKSKYLHAINDVGDSDIDKFIQIISLELTKVQTRFVQEFSHFEVVIDLMKPIPDKYTSDIGQIKLFHKDQSLYIQEESDVYNHIETLLKSGFGKSFEYFSNHFTRHFKEVIYNVPDTVKLGTKESYKDHIAKNVKIKAFEFFKGQNKSATISELIDAASHATLLLEAMEDDFITNLHTKSEDEVDWYNSNLFGEHDEIDFGF